MMKWILLIVGGSIGTLSRYALSGAIYRWAGIGFPYGTLVVNLSGCFFIGFLTALAEKKFLLGTDMRLFLMVGFCGAFTTFSTFIFETDNLVKDGEMTRALLNILISVIAGFIVFRIGSFIGEFL